MRALENAAADPDVSLYVGSEG